MTATDAPVRTTPSPTLAVASALFSGPGFVLVVFGLLSIVAKDFVQDFSIDLGSTILKGTPPTGDDEAAQAGLAYLGVGLVYLAAGVGLALARPWARFVATVLAGFHLFVTIGALTSTDGVALGVIFAILLVVELWLLWSPASSEAIRAA